MPKASYGQRAGGSRPAKRTGIAVSRSTTSSTQIRRALQQAKEDPTSLQAADIHSLQRTIGNQATVRLMQPTIQAQREAASTATVPAIQRKEHGFSDEKDLQPLIRKVTYYSDQSTNNQIGSATQERYQNVATRYEKLVALLNQYNAIPQDDTDYDQQLDLLEGIRFWIDKLYEALKALWHTDRVMSDEGGSFSDELSANARRGKIAKDMNGSFLDALMGNGGRLHKLSSKVTDEIERVTEQQANQPAQEWGYAQPQDFVYSPFRKTKKQKRQEFSDRLANPYVIAGQQRGFLPHTVSNEKRSGIWIGGNRWQETTPDTSLPQNTSFGSNGSFGSRWQWQNGTAEGERGHRLLGSHRVWQETKPDMSQPQSTKFGSNGVFGSRRQWRNAQADTSQPQSEDFGSNGSFGSRHQWKGAQADISQPQSEDFGSNGSFGSRHQWKRAFPKDLDE